MGLVGLHQDIAGPEVLSLLSQKKGITLSSRGALGSLYQKCRLFSGEFSVSPSLPTEAGNKFFSPI